jgi:hypothetical protein
MRRKPTPRSDQLTEAVRLVEVVAATLNVDKEKCSDCDHVVYYDFAEAAAHKALGAAVTRINRVIHVLQTEADGSGGAP